MDSPTFDINNAGCISMNYLPIIIYQSPDITRTPNGDIPIVWG